MIRVSGWAYFTFDYNWTFQIHGNYLNWLCFSECYICDRISNIIINNMADKTMYPTGPTCPTCILRRVFIAAITAFIKNSYSHLWWAQILSICENRWFKRVWKYFPEVNLVKDPTLEATLIMDYQREYCGTFCRTADDAALVDRSDCGWICCFRLQFARS